MQKEQPDDPFAIDWSETAYNLPEPHLITEKTFQEHDIMKFNYKGYFNFIREIHGLLPVKLNDLPPVKTKNISQHKNIEQSSDISNQKSTDQSNEKSAPKRKLESPMTHIKIPKIQGALSDDLKSYIIKKHYDEKSGTDYHLLTREQRRSNIGNAERHHYHDFLNKKKGKAKDQRKMKELLPKILGEQNEYQQFLLHAALKNMHRYIYLSDNVRNCVVNHVHDRVSKLLQHQKKFKMSQQINLLQLPPAPKNPFLTFVRRVYEEGSIPEYELPPIGSKLSFDSMVLKDKKENCISDDVVMTMCKSENVEFYIKSSALIAIMEGLVVDTREWTLSLKIKEVEIGKEHKQKVGIICQPLPRRVMSTRESNKLYYTRLMKNKQSNHTTSGTGSKQSESDNTKDGPGVPGEDLIIDTGDNSDHVTTQKASEREPNIHVNLFSLGDLQILLETTVDQYDISTNTTFQISPKCEYQYNVGFEQFSILELCQTFWDSHISNTDWIVCPRINIRNDIITRHDTYSRDVLCPSACPYNPRLFCNHLYYILNELRSLSPGEYILERAVREHTIKICQENVEGIAPGMVYKNIMNKNEFIVDMASPWLPIDTAIMTDHFVTHHLIPGLFSQFQTWPDKKSGGKKKNNKKNREWDSQIDIQLPCTDMEPPKVYSNRTVTSYAEDEF